MDTAEGADGVTEPTSPRRAYCLRLDIEADNLQAIADALSDLSIQAEDGVLCTGAGVSARFSWKCGINQDPAINGDQYVEMIVAYHEWLKGLAKMTKGPDE